MYFLIQCFILGSGPWLSDFEAEAFYLCLEQLWANGDLPGFAIHSMSPGLRVSVSTVSIVSKRDLYIFGFPKMVDLPNNHGVFLLKVDHFRVEIGGTTIWGKIHIMIHLLCVLLGFVQRGGNKHVFFFVGGGEEFWEAGWKYMNIYEQPPLFGKERNSLWMETFFFQIHHAYGNEVGGNPKTRW